MFAHVVLKMITDAWSGCPPGVYMDYSSRGAPVLVVPEGQILKTATQPRTEPTSHTPWETLKPRPLGRQPLNEIAGPESFSNIIFISISRHGAAAPPRMCRTPIAPKQVEWQLILRTEIRIAGKSELRSWYFLNQTENHIGVRVSLLALTTTSRIFWRLPAAGPTMIVQIEFVFVPATTSSSQLSTD